MFQPYENVSDSVIFSTLTGEWVPPTGSFLGDLTDELEKYGTGSYIDEFLCAGPKNYSLKIWGTRGQEYHYVVKV